ncbi:putative Mg2+ transporter-C (MgtC) family protein [Cohaesibacter sp. ES.047]|uniref:MgtC/SapB family protein n=1 Tax=Cohaesibacter sp. ES.047 TaxID=1798205 RepID=UPI000BB6C5B5|nr:MgtC/SapB family protein [Cohaesibacter sp. ES.047]SNY92961.1 putative Mg2+ transporter-C (MgtC) family protein [Cohaesibacter sp. ES.047]
MNSELLFWGTDTWLGIDVIAIRLFVALFLGAVVGVEREWQRNSAGLRTHILVSLASATLAILSIDIAHLSVFNDEAVRTDPFRLIEAVTSGVAFLAAGLIVFNRGRVRNLTTGAGMWLAAAIGLASGFGLWQVAILATVLAFVVLGLLGLLEARLLKHKKEKLEEE